MKIKVILADDHALFRAGLRSLLQAVDDCDVIGETDNDRDVLALAREREPDVVIMDAAMPDLNCVDVTRKLARKLPGVPVLALSSHADGSYVKGMLEAGARGGRIDLAWLASGHGPDRLNQSTGRHDTAEFRRCDAPVDPRRRKRRRRALIT